MNPPKSAPVILNERDDSAIDKLLDDPTYGPNYIVSVDVSRKSGNMTPKVRTGIQCPLLQVKSLAVAMCELVSGGGQYKIDVYWDDRGNKKKLLTPWWESFTDPPRMGKPYDDLTLFWDETGGENSVGAWTTTARGGTGRAAVEAPPTGGYGFGSVAASAPVDFPRPMRGLHGTLMEPPPHLMRLLPPAYRNYGAEQQWQILAANYEQTTGRRANLEPVDIMGQWKNEKGAELGDVRVEKTRLEERNEQLRETNRREVDAANRRVADLERTVAELKAHSERALERAEAKAREEKRDLEMQQLREQINKPARAAEPAAKSGPLGGIDPAVMTAAISAFVSMRNADSDRNMQMMLALMKPPAPPPPQPGLFEQVTPLIVAIAPVLAPVIQGIMAARDPEKINELETERSMRQMQLAQMLMEQIKSMVPQEEAPPIWFPPVMAVIEGMMGTLKTAAISAGAQRLPPMLPQQQPQPQQQQSRVVEARVEQRPVEQRQAQPPIEQQPVEEEQRPDANAIEVPPTDLEKQIDGLAKIDPTAANITRLVMRTISAREIDPRLLTPEWTLIVFNVHFRPAGITPEQEHHRVMQLIGSIVDHLEHCREYQLLPKELATVFEKPEALAPLLDLMPAFMTDREYGGMLFTELVEEIRLRENERRRELEGDDDESGETELEDEDEEEEDGDEAAGGSR